MFKNIENPKTSV